MHPESSNAPLWHRGSIWQKLCDIHLMCVLLQVAGLVISRVRTLQSNPKMSSADTAAWRGVEGLKSAPSLRSLRIGGQNRIDGQRKVKSRAGAEP